MKRDFTKRLALLKTQAKACYSTDSVSRLAFIISAICLCAGCSTLFAPQQLSENYALAEGVECDAPEAVDGDLNTVSNNTRIVISLPEKKSIRKIIIHSPNISNFILYESIGEEGEWRPIKSVKGNRLTEVAINTHVTTDKIRMFVTDTSGGRFAEPESLRDVDGRTNIFSRQVDAPPQIQEIELYGLVDKIEPKAPLF
jgi:hypothetical protein